MDNVLQLGLAFAFTVIAGTSVAPFLRWLRKKINVPTISSDKELEGAWKELRRHPEPSGTWVGIFERILFFMFLYLDNWAAIGIWMAFKVAAKWEARNHIGYLPDSPDMSNTVPPMKWARARRVWAAQEYATFVVGTAWNLLFAWVGVLFARLDPRVVTHWIGIISG